MVNGKDLIVVLGMHRSGTSAITKGLETMGVKLGDRLMPPIANINEKGFYEDLDIVALNEELLQACGRHWYSLEPIQPIDVDYLCDYGYLSQAVNLLHNKLAANERFGFKDPRTAKLLSFWSRVFVASGIDVRYILALRNPLSIVKSLAERDKFDSEQSFFMWIDHTLTSLFYLQGRPSIIVDYDQLMYDPKGELNRVAAWLNVNIDRDALMDYCQNFLEEKLRHSRFKPDDVHANAAVPALAKEIYGFLTAVLTGQINIESACLRDWMHELERLSPALRLVDKLHSQINDNKQIVSQAEAVTKDWVARGEHIEYLARTIESLQEVLQKQTEQTEVVTKD